MEAEIQPRVTVEIVLDHELATETPLLNLIVAMGKETIAVVRRFEAEFFSGP
jgi:hypothetical protein